MYGTQYRTRFSAFESLVEETLQRYRTDPTTNKDRPFEEQITAFLRDLWSVTGEDRLQELVHEALMSTPLYSTPPELRIGKVTHFNNDPKKRFGFVNENPTATNRHEDVFFHMDQGVAVHCNGGDEPAIDHNKNPLYPTKGDLLVYKSVPSHRKIGQAVTEWWAYHSEWDAAVKAIVNRPIYRLKMVMRGFDLWNGQNLEHLRMMYPKAYHIDGTPTDMSLYYFEKQVITDAVLMGVKMSTVKKITWEPCEDPR